MDAEYLGYLTIHYYIEPIISLKMNKFHKIYMTYVSDDSRNVISQYYEIVNETAAQTAVYYVDVDSKDILYKPIIYRGKTGNLGWNVVVRNHLDVIIRGISLGGYFGNPPSFSFEVKPGGETASAQLAPNTFDIIVLGEVGEVNQGGGSPV